MENSISRRYTSYDENGNVAKILNFENDARTEKVIFKYDTAGKLVTTNIYYPTHRAVLYHKGDNYTSIVKNNKDKIISRGSLIVTLQDNGTKVSTTVNMTPDNKQGIVDTEIMDIDGKLTYSDHMEFKEVSNSSISWTFDKDGNEIREVDSNSPYIITSEVERDEQDRTKSIMTYAAYKDEYKAIATNLGVSETEDGKSIISKTGRVYAEDGGYTDTISVYNKMDDIYTIQDICTFDKYGNLLKSIDFESSVCIINVYEYADDKGTIKSAEKLINKFIVNADDPQSVELTSLMAATVVDIAYNADMKEVYKVINQIIYDMNF